MKDQKTNSHNKLLKLCFAAMFTALICVATMIIKIPTPVGGYVNFGDGFILIAAWVLGPVYGFAAGAIGSALADAFAGYFQYVPGTFVIKGLIALAAALIAGAFAKKNSGKFMLAGHALGALAGEIIMIGGYYLYEATFLSYGFAGAMAGIFGNVVQGIFGCVFGVVLVLVLSKTKVFAKVDTFAV